MRPTEASRSKTRSDEGGPTKKVTGPEPDVLEESDSETRSPMVSRDPVCDTHAKRSSRPRVSAVRS